MEFSMTSLSAAFSPRRKGDFLNRGKMLADDVSPPA
jgi:hypothetical protein